MVSDTVSWNFYGYMTRAEGRTVQEWFDALSEDEQDETRDTIGYLQHVRLDQWKYPQFEHLGEGLSEIRFRVSSLNLTVRIYGTFWPVGKRFSYTFLLGGNKKVTNDKLGKKEARRRKGLLEKGESTVHEFKFSNESNSEVKKGKAKAVAIR
jgi:hypothetical protein